ncbi:MAG: peroxiredoxin [Gammaproteobacteria bacterium]|nr:peroxiredoxin [Gammaproteobacteria bacterium]
MQTNNPPRSNKIVSGIRASWRNSLVVRICVIILGYLAISPTLAEESDMQIDMPAPAFTLQDQNAVQRNLADYRGHWVVLYFYPKDDTPGCTTEACHFRDDYVEIKKLGADILGVSIDSEKSHAAFARKFSLPFPLLADKDGAVAKQYGALWGIWPVRFARRHTFLINPEGNIARIYRKVDPSKHSAELIAAIKELSGHTP